MNFTKKFLTLTLSGTAACLIACGDDSSSTEVISRGADDSMDILAHNEDLDKQECDKGNAGEKLFVVDSNAAFVCNGKSWELYDATEDISGECTTKSVKNAKKTKSGVQITCDGAVVDTLWDGDKGADEADEDGCSFKAVKNKDKTKSGMEVQCGDVVLDTIWKDSDSKDSDSKESADSKKDSDSKESADSKKDSDSKESADSKKDSDSKESADSKKDSDSKESADSKKDSDSKESAESKDDSDSKESAESKDDSDSKESADGKDDSESKESDDGKDGEGCVQKDLGHSISIQCGDAEPTIIPKAKCITIPYDPEVSYCKEGYVLSKDGEFPAGSMVDERDFQEYKIVKIGDDIWMAGNLNYETEGSICGGGSDKDTDGDCDTYGRLYDFKTASEICPDGWRLPTESEALKVTEGRSGSALRTADLWDLGSHVAVGTDEIGFSAIPSGYFKDGEYYGVGSSFVAWTSSKAGGRLRQLHVYGAIAPGTHDTLEEDGFGSVRCVKE